MKFYNAAKTGMILALLLLLTSCGPGASTTGKITYEKMNYTKMQEVQFEGSYNEVLGFSPNGNSIVTANEDEIQVIDIKTGKPINTFSTELSLVKSKKALWSKEGNSFLLGDSGYTPVELMYMKSTNISVFPLKGEAEMVTDEGLSNKLPDLAMLSSPSWSSNGKGIIYSSFGKDGAAVKKVDIKTGKTKVLYEKNDRSYFVNGIELNDSTILCNVNGAKKELRYVFIYDVKKQEKKNINELKPSNDKNAIYEIAGYSSDRRTVLVNKWTPLSRGMGDIVIQESSILTFNSNFTDYEIKKMRFSIDSNEGTQALYNPGFLSKSGASNRIALNAILSPDGRYLVCRQDEITANEKIPTINNRELVLYDLVKDKQYTLMATKEDSFYGVSIPVNGNTDGLYLSKNGDLMVWFEGGYKLYKLLE